jgi:hypothetical protein
MRRVCDERCWYAAGGRCACICSGVNHGKKKGQYIKPEPPDIFGPDEKGVDNDERGFNSA